MLDWIADIVQNPCEPKGTAVVLRGGEGSGKGLFARAVGYLAKPHFLPLTTSAQVTSRFNAHLAATLVVFHDEAAWSFDKGGRGALYALITEPILAIERKFKDITTMVNCSRSIIGGNQDYQVPAGVDSRRWFVLDLNEEKKQNTDYFGKLKAAIHDRQAMGAFFAFLKNRKIRSDLRKAPDTEGLTHQKLESLPHIERWWHGVLTAGELKIKQEFMEEHRTMPLGGRIDYRDVQESWNQYVRENRLGRFICSSQLGKKLSKMVPGVRRTRPNDGGRRSKQYVFPDLDVCRQQFAKYLNTENLIWDDEGMEEDTKPTDGEPKEEIKGEAEGKLIPAGPG